MGQKRMNLGARSIILLIFLSFLALPLWPYSLGWGYYPSGGFGVALIILAVFLLSIPPLSKESKGSFKQSSRI